MKIKFLSLIALSCALIPAAFCGCNSNRPDDGTGMNEIPDTRIITEDENTDCPDGECPDNGENAEENPDCENDGECPDKDKPFPHGRRRFLPHKIPHEPIGENKPSPVPFDVSDKGKKPELKPVPDTPEQIGNN